MHDRCSQETRNKQNPGLTPVLLPQDPTVCQTLNRITLIPHRSRRTGDPEGQPVTVLGEEKNTRPLFADIPPVSTRRRTNVCATGIYS